MKRAVLAAAALLLMVMPAAEAEIRGPCTGEIHGVDVALRDSGKWSDAIHIGKDEVVEYLFTAEVPKDHHDLYIEWGPFRFPLPDNNQSEAEEDDTRFYDEGTIDAASLSWLASGIYRLSTDVRLENGQECDGAALIEIDRTPFTTLFGWISMLMFVGASWGAWLLTWRKGMAGPRSVLKQMDAEGRAGR